MEDEHAAMKHLPPTPANTAPLWAGVLGAPLVWAIELQVVYAAAHQACAHHKLGLLHLLDILCLVLAALAGWVCLRYWRRDQEDEEDRTRFLASYGLLSCAIFFVLILAQTIAAW